jgi:hypothetical protein
MRDGNPKNGDMPAPLLAAGMTLRLLESFLPQQKSAHEQAYAHDDEN